MVLQSDDDKKIILQQKVDENFRVMKVKMILLFVPVLNNAS